LIIVVREKLVVCCEKRGKEIVLGKFRNLKSHSTENSLHQLL